MAKQGLLGSVLQQFTTGVARKAGWRTWGAVERGLGQAVINPNSRLRKAMQRFQLTGNVRAGSSKVYGLIELFMEEYSVDRGMLQRSTYMEADREFISRKIDYIGQLSRTDLERQTYTDLSAFWGSIQSQL